MSDEQTPSGKGSTEDLKTKVIETLTSCYDPEIPVNIYELGLIYHVNVDAKGIVSIRMTLTSPSCPVAGSLPFEIESKLRDIEGVSEARVEIVWDPPWSPDMMTDAARLQLGLL